MGKRLRYKSKWKIKTKLRWQNIKKLLQMDTEKYLKIKLILYDDGIFFTYKFLRKLLYSKFSLYKYLPCSHWRKMDQNPILKMESSFSVSDFRELNSVTGANTSPGKMKEEEGNKKKCHNNKCNKILLIIIKENLSCSFIFNSYKLNSALKINFSQRSCVEKNW